MAKTITRAGSTYQQDNGTGNNLSLVEFNESVTVTNAYRIDITIAAAGTAVIYPASESGDVKIDAVVTYDGAVAEASREVTYADATYTVKAGRHMSFVMADATGTVTNPTAGSIRIQGVIYKV